MPLSTNWIRATAWICCGCLGAVLHTTAGQAHAQDLFCKVTNDEPRAVNNVVEIEYDLTAADVVATCLVVLEVSLDRGATYQQVYSVEVAPGEGNVVRWQAPHQFDLTDLAHRWSVSVEVDPPPQPSSPAPWWLSASLVTSLDELPSGSEGHQAIGGLAALGGAPWAGVALALEVSFSLRPFLDAVPDGPTSVSRFRRDTFGSATLGYDITPGGPVSLTPVAGGGIAFLHSATPFEGTLRITPQATVGSDLRVDLGDSAWQVLGQYRFYAIGAGAANETFRPRFHHRLGAGVRWILGERRD